ncbi:hypothetical protein BDQ12DRAFT_686103 [Crucibulum laeve]|uniref:RRM domain-containing protein n=1 Tax=Crucibulum laeve TaxID=68775 RepID=A0A5C3LYI5_9AGAR|nr:hypothetical protein BDQ12DRAFT_686103 [Crucibulum laeve]
MPHKPVIQPRAWGTRFDTLPSSPPVSPTRGSHKVDSIHALAHSSLQPHPNDNRETKQPHDASVFVGSLPTNIDLGVLTRMLTDHLSKHATVKDVKVIRDNNGGVCAFVQCENAASASALIETLHSSEQIPFMGRILRYEPARAMRSLLISYRAPMEVITHLDGPGAHSKELIPLEPPFAMLVWKPKYNRFHSIVYNDEAIDIHARNTETEGLSLKERGVFLKPVLFDAESIQKIAGQFGPLERLEMFQSNDTNLSCGQKYPEPHDAQRSKNMDTGCWEVKWAHRDDCVDALMTLRKIPHITVSWAHRPPGYVYDQQRRLGWVGSSPGSRFLHPGQSRDRFSESSAEQSFSSSVNAATTSSTSAQRKWTETDFPPLSMTSSEHGHARTDSERPALSSSEVHTSHSTMDDSNRQKEDVSSHQLGVSDGFVDHEELRSTSRNGSQFMHDNCPHHIERELDPTTLFVGGLEMFGPGAWDETKLQAVFGRFGGLENVRLISPQNSHTAFAFVKYNNTESPARAVAEEHNRVYEGRAMRVQLRDCNPNRGWKHGGRSRGRFYHHNFAPQRQFNNGGSSRFTEDEEHEDFSGDGQHEDSQQGIVSTPKDSAPAEGDSEHKDADTESLLGQSSNKLDSGVSSVSSPSEAAGATDESSHSVIFSPDSPHSIHSSPCPVAISKEVVISPKAIESSDPPQDTKPVIVVTEASPQVYQEWYDRPASAPVLGSQSTSMPQAMSSSYAVPPGYYASLPWMHPYQGQYAMPYYGGYVGYPMPNHQALPQFGAPPNMDSNGSASRPPAWSPMGIYGAYIPYPAASSAKDQGVGDIPVSQHANGQPPVVPAGFIQNEQGTLIAVYQPEALDKYMAGTGGSPPATTQSISNVMRWPQNGFPYPYSFQAPSQNISMLPQGFASPGRQSWNPHLQSFLSSPPGLHFQQPATVQSSGPPPFRGPYYGSDVKRPPPQMHRGRGRRDQMPPLNPPWQGQGQGQGHSRPPNRRQYRNNAPNSGYTERSELEQFQPRHPALNTDNWARL